MTSLTEAIKQIKQMVIPRSILMGSGRGHRATPRGLLELEESPRVSVEGESHMNIRVHKVANGWVVNKTVETSSGYESETHVCGNDDSVVDKVTELVALYKVNS